MADFMIQFLLCNLFISLIIGIFLLMKHLLKNILTRRTHYNLWFLMLLLLTVPFIPLQPFPFLQIFTQFLHFKQLPQSPIETSVGKNDTPTRFHAENWMNDFGISVSQKTPSTIGMVLFFLWLIGIFIMVFLIVKSTLRFRAIKKSALPLQNPAVRRLYRNCLEELNISKPIPIYSTAFLKSPMIAGLFHSRIYLPIHLISDYQADDMRYMLLHELVHYKYKDALANYCMSIVGIFYWFNPFVWCALKEMKNDREVACDTSVLKLLDETAYKDYGNTLINFAWKVSRISFPFTTGISGSMKQMQKRIRNIADYRPSSFRKKICSILIYMITACFLAGAVPLLSIQAKEQDRYDFPKTDRKISYIDLSHLFGEYQGSFVLYDTAMDSWRIYNKELAAKRISPASTYKIYSALFALESGIITPEQSRIRWDGTHYKYDLWNDDQTLESAMKNSVTWYFQSLDKRNGLSSIREYINKINYGNQRIEGDVSSYWIDSPLKISPIEQVEMLKKMYDNQFGFSPEHIQTVKDSICLSKTKQGALSGKTGTKEVNGENTCGWFIGYIEQGSRTYFFATNIQNETLASGPYAAELTFSILSELDLWNDRSF